MMDSLPWPLNLSRRFVCGTTRSRPRTACAAACNCVNRVNLLSWRVNALTA
jgi:hypothetical protein